MKRGGTQLAIGCTAIAGIVVFFGGLILWLMLSGGGALGALYRGDQQMLNMAPVGLVVAGLGALVTAGAVVYGLTQAFGDNSKKPVQVLEDAYVVSRYVLDRRGELVFEFEFLDPAELRYYVQLRHAHANEEYQTSAEVFGLCGEGMLGLAHVQGAWLSSFAPHLGHDSAPRDPFVDRQTQ